MIIKDNTVANPWIEPVPITQRLDMRELFPGADRVVVDLGAGDGGFALDYAESLPNAGVLAVERLLGRARKIAKSALRRSLDKVRVLRLESFYTVKYLLPAGSVDEIHIMHPDPWPKKKHHKHRLFSRDFLEACYQALRDDGILRLTTDHTGYLAFALNEARHCAFFQSEAWVPEGSYPSSDFERMFRGESRLVFRQQWRKSGG